MNWTQIFRENLNCYALSIYRVFVLLASSDSDKHYFMLNYEAKSVNKDSPIIVLSLYVKYLVLCSTVLKLSYWSDFHNSEKSLSVILDIR